MKFSIIAAVDQNLGLGKDNKLVWRLPAELKYFTDTTSKVEKEGNTNAVIMGRNTWESLPAVSQPLAQRLNVVLSRDTKSLQLPKGVLAASSLDEAFQQLEKVPNLEKVFVIGGAKLYAEAINHPDCDFVYLTRIDKIFDCDTFFPFVDPERFTVIKESPIQEEKGLKYKFMVYKKK